MKVRFETMNPFSLRHEINRNHFDIKLNLSVIKSVCVCHWRRCLRNVTAVRCRMAAGLGLEGLGVSATLCPQRKCVTCS